MESGCRTPKTAPSPLRVLSICQVQPRPEKSRFPKGWSKVRQIVPAFWRRTTSSTFSKPSNFCLKPQGYDVDVARSPELVREALSSTSYDAVLIDLNYTRDTTSGQEGLGLLSDIVAIDNTLPVVVMTAWGNVELAVEAMRRGARDFIQKPWENERLLSILRTQVELHRALQRAERLAAENRLLSVQGRPQFIATAPSMIPVLEADHSFRAVGRECPDYRRAWNGQRGSGADDPCVCHCEARVSWWP